MPGPGVRNRSWLRARRGATRPEWLIALALLFAVGSAGFLAWAETRRSARIARTYDELRTLVTACSRFYREYGVWPTEDASVGDADASVGADGRNRRVVFRLRAVEGEGNEAHRNNPRRIDFLLPLPDDPRPTTPNLAATGDVLDPWGNPYRLAFDSNYDGALELRGDYSLRIPGEGVAIWSAGPDQRYGTRDDIRTWR